MNNSILFLFLSILLISCQQENKTTSTPQITDKVVRDSLTAEIDSLLNTGGVNGFAVAAVSDKGTLYSKGFGYADVENKKLYTDNTIQHIASISKTFIGIALMKAQEMGKLDLDDPIKKHLSFPVIHPKYLNEEITIRHLATHTSGINDTDMYMDLAWIITENQDLEGISTDYPAQRLNPAEKNIPMENYLVGYLNPQGAYFQSDNYIDNKPGELYNYSNVGATLAAFVIEKATGQKFDAFTEEHILRPLGMDASGWSLKDVDVNMHSKLYRGDNTLLPFYTAITYPDGMFITSSNDIAKYLTELIRGYAGEGILLKKESYQEFYREQLKPENFTERDANHPYDGDYNPAIFIGHSALGYVGHSGGDAGVATWMYFNKETKTGRFIMVNSDMNVRKDELQYYAVWDAMDKYIDRLDVMKSK